MAGQNTIAGYVRIGVDLSLPIDALPLSYQLFIDERAAGSIKFPLGLPLTRARILLGRMGGRSVGVRTAAVAAMLVLAAVGLIERGTFALPPFLGMLVATLLFTGMMVAIGVFISTVARRTVTAATGVSAYLLTMIFQNRIVTSFYIAVTGVPVNPHDASVSEPLSLALRLTPSGACNTPTNWFLGAGNPTELFHIVYTKLEPGVPVDVLVVEAVFDGGVPWCLHPALNLVVLLVWVVVPMALARHAFIRGNAP